MRKDIPVGLQYAADEEDCTGGLMIEVSDDSGKVGSDVLHHGCPQSCMPNPVEGLLEVYENPEPATY